MTRFRPLFFFVTVASATVVACSGWDPSRPFEREAPQVNEALRFYDAGEAGTAAELLGDYLGTGKCEDSNIGMPDSITQKSNGSFDLGLAFFKIAEAYGHRFGDEENDGGAGDTQKGRRAEHVECALKIVRKVAEDSSQPIPLRARARYVEGNLLFLSTSYQDAVAAYDKALELAPAMGDGGPQVALDAGHAVAYAPDLVGRDAAWNRAIALRRIEDKKDAGNDAGNQGDSGSGDGGGEKNDPDAGKGKDDGGADGGKGDKNKDAGGDKGDPPKPEDKDGGGKPPEPPPEPPHDSRQSQDERMLDQLENAPTVQRAAAIKAGKQPSKGMIDK